MSTIDINFQVRSNEQLIMLLKLVDANQIETQNDAKIRQKLWKNVAEKLNRLSANGAVKDGDGWKRCFKSWRMSVGPNYKMKMQELTSDLPSSDDTYIIKLSDDEQQIEYNPESNIISSIEKQKQLLHELILKHKMLLCSPANDEPLKTRLWQNISEELNAIENGLNLTPLQWKESVDLDKYRTKRGRKRKFAKTENNAKNLSYQSSDDATQASTSSKNQLNPNNQQNGKTNDFLERIKMIDDQLEENVAGDVAYMSENESFSSEDDDIDDVKSPDQKRKRPKPTPLVRNFKFSNRMVCAVEQLRDDVQCVNNTIKQTTESLENIKNILEQQCEQQEEFNALLKRSTQLLKVLVEIKIGKHTSISKMNYPINNLGERM